MSKTAVITGASRGIGKAAAQAFAHSGYNVVLNYNASRDAALSLAQELAGAGCSVLPVKADVSSGTEVESLLRAAQKAFGGADILVNNAGTAGELTLLTDTTEQFWDELFAVNVKGAFLCAKAFLPYMLGQKFGRIINISSMWGVSGASMEVCYSASKAALIGFTKALAKEAGPSGVTVNCIAPGLIDTGMNVGINAETIAELVAKTPLNRIGAPEDIAALALFLASDNAGFITGQVICADGGFL